ncbi:MAG TPA: helix-turn-helix domain-containing protein, partial [Jiangellaceae bacterium]|nr:helix-turn-helix domain-containing protein [Jiangellaceae bacterium]
MDVERNSLAGRAAVHAALGDSARLEIVDALTFADASPGELSRKFGMASNLLAHHLGVLESAGVVRRVRSEGDRRRTYVGLAVEALDGVVLGETRMAPRVVFVCTRNSARSQLAAALWAGCSDVPVASAGTHPADRVHPGAVAVANRRGLHLAGTHTYRVDDVLRPDDLVVAVCDQAHEELGAMARLHWSVPDPVRIDTDDAFDHAYSDLERRVGRLADAVRAA